jgi:hypothetical protein
MMVSLSKAQWPMLNNGPETNTNVDNFPGAQQTRLSTSEPATPYGLPAHLRRDTSQPLRNGRNNRRRTTSIVDAGQWGPGSDEHGLGGSVVGRRR